jgi:predicted O-methyltransferase YrrM
MTAIAQPDLQATIQAWDEAAWSLAALALASSGDGPPELTIAARGLLAASGFTGTPGGPLRGPGTSPPQQVASQVAATLHQAAQLASGHEVSWTAHSDEALLAQGTASAQAARAFAQFLLPAMGDLASRLAAPGARMLDIGTGVGALALGFAEAFPRLHVLGIDVFDRALGLARQALADSDAAARVTVRRQDVAEFADQAGFDLAFLPAPFIPPAAMRAGLPRVVAALRPGGWLMVAHGKFGGNPVQDALTQLKTIAYGGTALDEAAASHLLGDAGLTSVRLMPTPPGAPAVTIGHMPS